MARRALIAACLIALLAAGLFGGLDAQVASWIHRVTGAGARTDSQPIRAALGGRHFAIPANYFGVVGRTQGMDGDFIVSEGSYITGLQPDFTPRTLANQDAFSRVGCCMWFTVDPVRIAPREFYRRILVRYWSRFTPLSRSDEGDETHYVVRAARGSPTGTKMADLYVRKDAMGFTLCNRIEPPVIAILCSRDFADGNLLIKLSFGGRYVARRGALEAHVRDLLRRWRDAA